MQCKYMDKLFHNTEYNCQMALLLENYNNLLQDQMENKFPHDKLEQNWTLPYECLILAKSSKEHNFLH